MDQLIRLPAAEATHLYVCSYNIAPTGNRSGLFTFSGLKCYTSAMDKEKIEVYQKRLEVEKAKLLKGIAEAEQVPDFGNDVDAFDEETDEAEETANERAVGQTLRERVSGIDAALNKIKTGKYGVCEKCGGGISAEVLDLAPESRLCENCKSIRE